LRLFGADPMALRLPMILLGALALLLYALVARRIVGRRGALLFVLLLATDPSYLCHIRLDWGPVALMLLLKGLGAYLFLRWGETKRLWNLAGSGFFLGLGVFDKVNFVWFLLAVGLAALVVYWREFRARATLLTTSVFCASGILGMLPLLLYNVAFPLVTIREPFETSGGPLAASSVRKLQVLLETLQGGAVFRFVNAGDVQPLWDSYLPLSSPGGAAELPSALMAGLTASPFDHGSLLVLALLLTIVYLASRAFLRPSTMTRATVAVMLTALLIVAQLLVTNKATGSYHVMMLYPLPQLIVAIGAVEVWGVSQRRSKAKRHWLAPQRVAVALLAAAIVASNLLTDAGYLRYFQAEGGRGIWSSAIYDLVEYAEANRDRRLVLMDWGFNTQLLTLSRGEIRKDEVYHWLTPGQLERERFDAYLQDPGSLFVFHSPQYTKVARPKEVFATVLQEKGLKEEVVKRFQQRNGEEVYYLSRVVPAEGLPQPGPATPSAGR
ncbi:MAG: ArnT family glycosyltransferase, partial [Chloroflexota bacterium]